MSLQLTLLDFVGGHALAGTESESMQWVQRVRSGLSVDAVQTILDSGRLAPAELDQIVLPRKTLAHRRKLGTLTAEQSDRLLRVARLIATAEDTFGDQAKAAKWLRRPTSALSGERPLDLLDTDEGARAVETLLGQISHGIAA
jgi:putative toxin-antitoxin system antitoxin component (TIGR02293 family)